MTEPRTMLDKIWAQHAIVPRPGGEELLFVDWNLVHEGGTFLAFDQLRMERRKVRKPRQTLAVTDHYLPSLNRSAGVAGIANPEIRNVLEWLDQNTHEFGIDHIGVDDPRQGITHVIGPELGLTQPGLLIVCCDSHTATQGALGALAVPIGQSNQLRHVLATQTLWQKKPKTMRITIDGALPPHVSPKDVILAVIARIGIGGAAGHAVEYAGSTIRGMSTGAEITVDLPAQAVTAPDGTQYAFDIDATRKERLLKGLDDVGVTFEHLPDIEAFEASYRGKMPWLRV